MRIRAGHRNRNVLVKSLVQSFLINLSYYHKSQKFIFSKFTFRQFDLFFCQGICKETFLETILALGGHLRGNLPEKCLLS